MGKTLFRKLAMAFLVGFVPPFLLGIVGVLDALSHVEGDSHVHPESWTWLLVSVATGAASAGIRAALAVFTNFVPGDEIHSPGPPDSVTVTTRGTRS